MVRKSFFFFPHFTSYFVNININATPLPSLRAPTQRSRDPRVQVHLEKTGLVLREPLKCGACDLQTNRQTRNGGGEEDEKEEKERLPLATGRPFEPIYAVGYSRLPTRTLST